MKAGARARSTGTADPHARLAHRVARARARRRIARANAALRRAYEIAQIPDALDRADGVAASQNALVGQDERCDPQRVRFGLPPMRERCQMHDAVDLRGCVHGTANPHVDASTACRPSRAQTRTFLACIMMGERFGEWMSRGELWSQDQRATASDAWMRVLFARVRRMHRCPCCRTAGAAGAKSGRRRAGSRSLLDDQRRLEIAHGVVVDVAARRVAARFGRRARLRAQSDATDGEIAYVQVHRYDADDDDIRAYRTGERRSSRSASQSSSMKPATSAGLSGDDGRVTSSVATPYRSRGRRAARLERFGARARG